MTPLLAPWLPAFAQPPAPQLHGEVVGIVFDADGRPVPHARVWADDDDTLTDEGGAWRLSLPPGTAEICVQTGTLAMVPVPVVAGRTTELLLTVRPEGPLITMETPPESAPASEVPQGPPGTLTGVITDADTGAPLPGVRLFVRGSPISATTGPDGRFALELASGRWDLSAVRAGYDTQSTAFEVVAHEERQLSLALRKSGLVLASLTVRAPKIAGNTASLLDERQSSSTVSDVLGAEQMSRAGDTDAASALRRVTGLTVIGGKYVYVRGLGDRYSSTLLDGSALPSPEPEKRVVPLDLFPSALLDSVVVQKTFSPDRPAEFGGGVVEIRTRSIPEEPVLSLSLSGNYAAATTGQWSALGARGPTDWLGFGTGYRALPGPLAEASEDQPIKAGGIFSEGGYSQDELERFGEMLPNRWALARHPLPPDLGLTVTGGGSVPMGGVKLGGLAALVFSSGWSRDEGFQTLFSQGAGGLAARRHTTFVETQSRVRLGGALALGASWEKGELGSTTLLMRNSAGTTLTYDADDPTGSNDTRNAQVGWLEQQLLFQQLSLRQDFSAFALEARYSGARATGREPDRRSWTYLLTDSGPVLSQRASWSEILYTTLDDTTHSLGLDLTVPVGEGRLKAGGLGTLRERTSTTRRFSYQFQGSEGIDLSAPIDQVLVPAHIGPEGPGDRGYLELEENTTSSDDYTARQRLLAGYLLGEIPWSERWSTLVGARVERSTQQVQTFELFDASLTPVVADLTTTDLLPALTVTWGIGPQQAPDRMQLRAGYGRTLSRPEFRELSEVAFYDYRSGRLLYGNPALQRATIDNFDLRWELYPRDGESVSLGVFYKWFDQPIESVVAVSAVSGSVGTFANATSASNAGAEIDLRKRLISDLWLTANASAIASRVDLSETEGNQTSDRRPLQGQSPWVINAQLSWEDPEARLTLAALYNVYGPRIVDVGTQGIPDTYELPVHRLDLVATQGLGPHWQVRARGSNLLGWPERKATGGQISEETRSGWGAGLSLTWTP